MILVNACLVSNRRRESRFHKRNDEPLYAAVNCKWINVDIDCVHQQPTILRASTTVGCRTANLQCGQDQHPSKANRDASRSAPLARPHTRSLSHARPFRKSISLTWENLASLESSPTMPTRSMLCLDDLDKSGMQN
jgi:hypothetical protein